MTVALPSYARVIMATASDTPMPSVDRCDMDRGPSQQRLINPHILFNSAVQFLFENMDDANNFVTWYITTLGVIGWFTMRHPRTRQQITARFPSGTLGDITPVTGGYAVATVVTTIEYYQ